MFSVKDELTEKSEMMIQKMRQALYDWLDEIDYSNNGCKTLLLDTNTFNYTTTLNRLYLMLDKSMLHIHHSVATHGSHLILGHGSIINEEPLFDNNGKGNYPSSS